MKILPARTQPPADLVERRHSPPSGKYATYRSCLRWEFGFCCAFCLVHEADLTEHGVEGTGLTWIEHHVPRSHDPSQQDMYTNCFYSCRFCNEARHTAPVLGESGRRLLDPCTSRWSHHFRSDSDQLLPRDGDADAAYTHETYDLDDPRKRAMRRNRATTIARAVGALRECPGRISRLLEIAERVEPSDRRELLDVAEQLQRHVDDALRELMRFRAVPSDADTACSCATVDLLSLPAYIEEQCFDAVGTRPGLPLSRPPGGPR